jgi:hypothetical protein
MVAAVAHALFFTTCRARVVVGCRACLFVVGARACLLLLLMHAFFCRSCVVVVVFVVLGPGGYACRVPSDVSRGVSVTAKRHDDDGTRPRGRHHAGRARIVWQGPHGPHDTRGLLCRRCPGELTTTTTTATTTTHTHTYTHTLPRTTATTTTDVLVAPSASIGHGCAMSLCRSSTGSAMSTHCPCKH